MMNIVKLYILHPRTSKMENNTTLISMKLNEMFCIFYDTDLMCCRFLLLFGISVAREMFIVQL